VYSDTGTFTCSYNGTLDLSSIDNSTNVHLYVDDGEHLLKHSSFEFYVATQGSTFNLPCMPTLPGVKFNNQLQISELMFQKAKLF